MPMFLRTTLMVVLTLLSIAVCAQQKVAAPLSGGGTRTTVAPLAVVDATGKTVGRYASSYDFGNGGAVAVAYATINGLSTTLKLGPGEPVSGIWSVALVLASSKGLYFASNDCSGAPYVAPSYYGVRPSSYMVVNGSKLLYLASTLQATLVFAGSNLRFNGTSNVCYLWGATDYLLPANAPVDIGAMFAEPFTVQ